MKNARYMMLATNALINDLLNCESVAFVDMILAHITEGTSFEELMYGNDVTDDICDRIEAMEV